MFLIEYEIIHKILNEKKKKNQNYKNLWQKKFLMIKWIQQILMTNLKQINITLYLQHITRTDWFLTILAHGTDPRSTVVFVTHSMEVCLHFFSLTNYDNKNCFHENWFNSSWFWHSLFLINFFLFLLNSVRHSYIFCFLYLNFEFTIYVFDLPLLYDTHS